MAPRVVADEVACCVDLLDQPGLLLGEIANEEESCANFVIGQDFEQLRCPGWIGSVVESECYFSGPRWGCHYLSEDLGLGWDEPGQGTRILEHFVAEGLLAGFPD